MGHQSCRSFKKEIQSAANHLKIFENPIPIVCTSNHCIAKISCFLLQKIFTIPIKSQQRPRVFSQRPNLQLGFAYPKKKNIHYYRFPKWWMFHWENKKSTDSTKPGQGLHGHMRWFHQPRFLHKATAEHQPGMNTTRMGFLNLGSKHFF